MLILLHFFTFFYAFLRNCSANKRTRLLSEQNCDNKFNASEITFIGPIELFQKVVAKIEINSESNLFGDCFFEVKLEFRHSLNSLNILQFKTLTIGRKVLKAKKRIRVEFECRHFAVPGFYRLSLPSNFIVSSSAEWTQINAPNLAVQLHLPAITTIFPFCQNALSISWTLPNCEKVNEMVDFRLRIFASLIETDQNEQMLYLEEFLLAENVSNSKKHFIGTDQRNVPTNFLRIPCTKFDIIHEHFCFELVSVSKQYQQHQLWDRKCLRTEAITAQRKNGDDELWEWSEWSEWAKCSCQRNGTRKRTRHCQRKRTNLIERTTVGSISKAKTKAATFGKRGGCRGGQIMQREKCRQRECRPNATADQTSDLAVSSLAFGQSVPNLAFESGQSSNGNGTFQCFCGCKLLEQSQGIFFASLCAAKNIQRWKLEFGRPFRVQIIITDKRTDEDFPIEFEIIRENEEEKETIWKSSQNNNPHEENAIIEDTFEKVAIFELKGANGGDRIEFGRRRKQKKGTEFGILVEYKIIAFEEIPIKNLFDKLWSIGSKNPSKLMDNFCSKSPKFAHCSLLLGFCSLLIFLFALFMPPIVFVCIIKRHSKNRMEKQFRRICQNSVGNNSSALLVSTHCHNNELMRSADGTESTKLSNSLVICAKRKSAEGVTTVEQRSIGIQLSRNSTPRCASRQFWPRRRHSPSNCNGHHRTSADHSNGSIESETIEDNSNLAEDYWNEDDDFGAEQLQLGGRRANEFEGLSSHLVSYIDIDEIVRRESFNNKNSWNWRNSNFLSAAVAQRRDASTQHDLNSEITKQ